MKNYIQILILFLLGMLSGAATTITAVNVGSSPNDGTGDTLRAAMVKLNTNDSNLNADKVEDTNGSASGLTLSGTTAIGGTLNVSATTTISGGLTTTGTSTIAGFDDSDEVAETITNGKPSLWFDGAADYVSVADNANLSFTDGTDDLPFSVCAWVKFDDLTDNGILAKYSTSASIREWRFDFDATDKLEIAIRDTSGNEARVQSAALTSYEGQWIHVVATYSGAGPNSSNAFDAAADGMALYLNGVDVTGTVSNDGSYTGMSDTLQNVWVGRYGGVYAEGEIRNVQLFNSALTAAQVEQVYRSGVPFELDQASATATKTFDFSAGTDTLSTPTGGTVAGNIDAVSDGAESKDNTLRFTADTSTGEHNVTAGGIFSFGKDYKVKVVYYIPSGQSNIDGIRLASGGSTNYFSNNSMDTTGSWATQWVTATVTGGSGSLNVKCVDGGSVSFTDSGGDDLFYIAELEVYEAGCILDLEIGSTNGTTVPDRSGNFSGTLNSMTVAGNLVGLPSTLASYSPNPSSGQALLALGNGGSGADFEIDEDWSGTWTPSLQFSGANAGMTFASQEGNYAKIGNVCVVTFNFTLTAKGSSTGTATISGLPFTSKNVSANPIGGATITRISNMTGLTSAVLAQVNDNTTTATLSDASATGTFALDQGNFTDTTVLGGTIIYITED